MPQVPNEQPAVALAGAAHFLPHMPQLSTSDDEVTSQPFVALLSQSSLPLLHVKPQLLERQVAVEAAGAAQTVPQAPQFLGS